ncbi:enoyl-CoA hydratase-related protein [Candidatus Planktophila lacus]|uniref:enoyl-CoA hydratase/isomerase family protein n=1 Tax=Candidatus Planktophila lacus TaxID=1884913 RepID=UPI000BAC74AA
MSQITSRREGAIQILSFNRAEKMNALTREMYAGLANGLNEAAGDFAVRAVILTSEGDHFTAAAFKSGSVGLPANAAFAARLALDAAA